MDEIVKTCSKDNGKLDPNLAMMDENVEEWCEYNEHNIRVFNSFLFENLLNNNSSIIDMYMKVVIPNGKTGFFFL